MVLKASLSHERGGVKFGTLIGIRTIKSGVDGSLSRHGSRNGGRSMLVIGNFTFPFSVGTNVGYTYGVGRLA
jgi:hypothetical protein